MNKRVCQLKRCVILLGFGAGVCWGDSVPANGELRDAVVAYFRAPTDDRLSRLRRIESLASGDTHAVAEAIRAAPLWDALPPMGAWPVELAAGLTIRIAYRLPSLYDPAVASPLVVCMPDGVNLEESALADCLAPPGAVLATMSAPIGGTFHVDDPARAGDLAAVVREVRRRIHTDVNRTFLTGTDQGGDAAWIAGVISPEPFAGVAVSSAYPQAPYPQYLLPVLHENLALSGFHHAWEDTGNQPSFRQALVAALNSAFAEYAAAVQPARTMYSFVRRRPGDSAPPDWQRWLAQPRNATPDHFRLWFRYPQQGRRAWLSQIKWAGAVWEEEVISILPAATSNRDEFITSVLKNRMGLLEGRKEGQTIHIETRKCAEIELRVPIAWDTTKPFTVFINGRNRFAGDIVPSVKTMLDCASEAWDLENLVVALRRFRIAEGP